MGKERASTAGRNGAARGGGSGPPSEIGADEVDALFDATKANLTKDERQAIEDYQKTSNWVNPIMRGFESGSLPAEFRKQVDQQIKDINKAFTKAAPLKSDVVLYRGLGSSLKDANAGSVISDKAPASTSFSKAAWEKTGFQTSPTVLRITATKGTKAIPLHKTLNKNNPYKKQKEMLLAPGTKMKVTGISKNAKGQTVYDVKIVK